jgi:hypothetical protein
VHSPNAEEGEFMFTIAIVVFVVWAVALLFLVFRVRTVRRVLRCPILGTDVQVRFLEALPGSPIEVTACSALKPPTNIVCAERCLGLLAHRATEAGG